MRRRDVAAGIAEPTPEERAQAEAAAAEARAIAERHEAERPSRYEELFRAMLEKLTTIAAALERR